MKWPNFTKVTLDERNRLIRIGAGLHDGNWFVRIDLWSIGFRISKYVKPLCDLQDLLRKAIVAAQSECDRRTIAEFESVMKDDLNAYTRPGEVVYQVTMNEVLAYAKLLQQPLVTLCDKLEKQPRIGIKDGQTSFKIDYEEVDALIEQARRAHRLPHSPIPPKPGTGLYFLQYWSALAKEPT